MLKRIYIDNFKCLVNFELSLGPVNLFLGANGSGKSSVFDVLTRIRDFLIGDTKVGALFPPTDRTRWDSRPMQKFEIEVEGNGGVYKYDLAISHYAERGHLGTVQRVDTEILLFNEKPLFRLVQGQAQLFSDDHSEGPLLLGDRARSGVAAVQPRSDNTRLTWFREYMARLIVVKLVPSLMSAESRQEEDRVAPSMENFAAWFRYLTLERPAEVSRLTSELRTILDGFEDFKNRRVGETSRVLELYLPVSRAEDAWEWYRFDEISDGQRVLVALYTLLHCGLAEGTTICIDEPENFLALPEIQPWLSALTDLCGERGRQAVLISHHPLLINYLAPGSGHWFYREEGGPVRVAPISEEENGGVPISELVSRGWLHI